MDQAFVAAIGRRITEVSGRVFEVTSAVPASGGSINRGLVIADTTEKYFVKYNSADQLDMFNAEAAGLEAIRATATLRAPAPVITGVAGAHAYLVLEFLLLSRPREKTEAALGRALAAMHACTSEAFGWHRDNTIGSTPQKNGWDESWPRFFAEKRLGFQLQLPNAAELLGAGQRLLERVDRFFADYLPVPSLLHGDLWAGNVAAARSEPVIYDPAVYYGDREADIAMTELFGRRGDAFYGAYQEAWPLNAGYARRRNLYNLYHVLNHANLFGGGYVAQASDLIRRLLSEPV